MAAEADDTSEIEIESREASRGGREAQGDEGKHAVLRDSSIHSFTLIVASACFLSFVSSPGEGGGESDAQRCLRHVYENVISSRGPRLAIKKNPSARSVLLLYFLPTACSAPRCSRHVPRLFTH